MNHKYKRLQSLIDDENVKASDIDESLVTGYKGFYNRVVKRVIDIILALTITIIVSPILIITSLAIFIEDGTPIL